MSRIILMAFLALSASACTNVAQPPEVTDHSVAYWHDADHGVSCWLYGRGGGGYTGVISCLPDSDLAR